MLLELHGIERSFDNQKILNGVSMSVDRGEIVALLGPSGCGKTTLLRIIAGLETTDAGTLLLDGEELSKIPVHRRGFGLVFQDYALFPHKNVADNVAFGLRMMNWDHHRQEERVTQVLQLVGLSGFEDRRVYELSGGEQQRIALARSLAPSPRLVLLDEPLGALDRALREQLMGELRSILKQAGNLVADADRNDATVAGPGLPIQRPFVPGMTSIYVTHDQEEAFAVADRVIVMNTGRIEQEGTPVQLYQRPASRFVAHFLGMTNFLDADLLSRDPPMVLTAAGEFQLKQLQETTTGPMTLLVRPEAGNLVTGDEPGLNVLTGTVQDISFRGRHQLVTISVTTKNGVTHLRLIFGSSVTIPTESSELVFRLEPTELQLLTR